MCPTSSAVIDEAPIVRPRGVEHAADPLRFVIEAAHVDGAQANSAALGDPLHASRNPFGDGRVVIGPSNLVDPQILDLAKVRPLQQARVVGRVVRHHQRRRRIETRDEQATLLVHGESDGTTQRCHATPPDPVACRAQQLGGNGRIVDTLEEAEETDAVAVRLGV